MTSVEAEAEPKPEIQKAVSEILKITDGGEGVNVEYLPGLLQNKPVVVAYDGFEPSGRMHIAQGLVRALNTNRLTQNGVKFKFWVADWFALMNHKMGGDLKKIQKAGQLMIETWKACGMDMSNVEFIWASEEINSRNDEYWQLVLDISTKMNLNRVKRCTQIMGRKEGDDLSASQIFYPVMQCADVFFLKADICSLGLDQRKVNMMAVEYAGMLKRKFRPIILSHHMLMGLDGSDKMSKSNPDNAIFMDDTEADVKRKIRKAYCKPGEVNPNPMLEYCQYIILPILEKVEINRKEEHGGDVIYTNIEQITEDFASEKLHPNDLKTAVRNHINQLLDPIRKHFETNPKANQLLKQVKKYTS